MYRIAHDAVHPGIDDSVLAPTSPDAGKFVAAMAYLKAKAGIEVANPLPHTHSIVLGADTACVLEGRIIGTPASVHEARSMLLDFMEKEHAVVSGVALIETATQRRHLFADLANVRFGRPAEQSIDEYLDSGLWRGKAGGYNLLDRARAGWPIEYSGDPTTIMGLPMRALLSRLRKLGFNVPMAADQRVIERSN